MKLIKTAKIENGKPIYKISLTKDEWIDLGKQAGFWGDLWQGSKAVGQGVGQAAQGAWNIGKGAINIISTLFGGAQQSLAKLKQSLNPDTVSKLDQNQKTQMTQYTAQLSQEIEEINRMISQVDPSITPMKQIN